MGAKTKPQLVADLTLSSREYFFDLVQAAFNERKITTLPMVAGYLADLLDHYMVTDHLFDEENDSGRKSRNTLAELFLRAANAEPRVRMELLKKLGDTSLYVSGFFGDSLSRKLVDVDYYVEMGGSAYLSLSKVVQEDTFSQVYREFADRFLEFVEALSYISLQSQIQGAGNLLRLYEIYAQTGSEFARDQLFEKGVIALPGDALKKRDPRDPKGTQ